MWGSWRSGIAISSSCSGLALVEETSDPSGTVSSTGITATKSAKPRVKLVTQLTAIVNDLVQDILDGKMPAPKGVLTQA